MPIDTIEAYVCSDGSIHTDRDKAEAHELDYIGELFDGLLQIGMRATAGNVTRHDQYRMCLSLLEQRNEARELITALHKCLN